MSPLAGTWRLTRLALRRDRVAVPAWLLGLTAFLGMTTAMFVNTLVTRDDLVQEATIPTENVGLRMLGLTSGPSVGGAVMVRDYVLLCVLAALMNVLLVVRHTRQAEELGRADVIGATVVGRFADLAAALVVAAVAGAALAAALASSMIVNGLPVAGAVTAGVGVGAVAVLFAGVAAVAVQLGSSTRGAIGQSSAVLGVSFVLSGVGNMVGTADTEALRVESGWPAWLSPIGWAQQMRPFGGEHLWPLALFLVAYTALVSAAGTLLGRRDVGAGIWPQRRGRAHAARSLLSPAGLAFRLQRGSFAGWVVGMVGFGLIFGAMTEQIRDAHGRSLEFYDRFGGRDHLVQAWYASMATMAASVVAIYLTQSMLRARADEVDGTVEPLAASGVTRLRWIVGHLINAVGGSVVLLLGFAVGMGLAAGQVVGGTGRQVRDLVGAAAVQLPALFVVGGLVVALVAVVPRLAVLLAWSTVVGALLLGPIFGPPLRLPEAVMDLSPFSHVPAVPATGANAAPLVVLTVLCVVLAGLGVAAVRRRDLRLPA